MLIPIVLLWFTGLCYCGDERAFVPWDYTNKKGMGNIDQQHKYISPVENLLMQGIKLFQEYISPVDGDRCPMMPTCSTYALQAITKHGVFIGTMMTIDRLMHENDEVQHAPVVIHGEYIRFYDPVKNNDFWLEKK